MPSGSVTIRLDAEPFLECMSFLSDRAADLGDEIVNRLLDLLDSPDKLCRIEQRPASGTVRVVLQPSDSLLDVVAAVRAIEVDGDAGV